MQSYSVLSAVVAMDALIAHLLSRPLNKYRKPGFSQGLTRAYRQDIIMVITRAYTNQQV